MRIADEEDLVVGQRQRVGSHRIGFIRQSTRDKYSYVTTPGSVDALAMPAFPSNTTKQAPWNRAVRKNPALFGVPFVLLIVGASFAMTTFTQTRYDLQNQRHSSVSSFVPV